MYPSEGEMWGTVQPEAWKVHAHGGPEPVPDAIVQAARDYELDIEALHDYVEGECGLEAHNAGYGEAVGQHAAVLAAAGRVEALLDEFEIPRTAGIAQAIRAAILDPAGSAYPPVGEPDPAPVNTGVSAVTPPPVIIDPSGRPSTPPRILASGGKRITVKRCCNGCNRELGDATDAEMDAAVYGGGLPDVRVECGCAA